MIHLMKTESFTGNPAYSIPAYSSALGATDHASRYARGILMPRRENNLSTCPGTFPAPREY